MLRATQYVAALMIVMVLVGNSVTAQDTASPHKIAIRDFAFVPADITVKVGDEIIWTNEDDTLHSAWDMNDQFDTGMLEQGKSATFTFAQAGTFYYRSRHYAETRGTIVVEP